MKANNKQSGFTIIEVVIAIVVLAIGVAVGIFGMRMFNEQTTKTSTPTNNTSIQTDSKVANDVPTAPVINSVESLDTATKTLDGINLDSDTSGDTTKLDTQTADF